MKMKSNTIRVAAALLGATGLLLVSCGAGGPRQDAAPSPAAGSSESETRSTVTVTSTVERKGIDVDFDSLQQVDPSTFREGTRQSLKYVVDGKAGECFVGGEFVTCIGKAAGDVPDVDMPPFSGRPGAVMIGAAGVAYTIVEGVPPARMELETGQWVDFGSVQCGKPDDSRLVCRADSTAIQIKGSGRDIATEGPVLAADELQARASDKPPTEYKTGTDVLVKAPMLCGAMEGHRLADVVEGEITCKEAMEVLDEYDSRADAEGTGNAMHVQFDGWVCSSPTAGRSQQLGASTVCEHSARGIRVHAPA